jgi:DNA-3-methyladenine glycosylase I
MSATSTPVRCAWAASNPLFFNYHDIEWGVPVHDDRKLFEMLTLEGAQAGLSWQTILKKRMNYRAAFNNFRPDIVAHYNPATIRRLMKNEGIVRNRLKIEGTIKNAKAFLAAQGEFGTFDAYVWRFVAGKPMINARTSSGEVPARTTVSDAMSEDFRKRGFTFVGSTICYAFMQAVGMVNDHTTDCFRYIECVTMR